MGTEYIEVTHEYLNKHRTKKGAWTRKQLTALGIEWPPTQGWKDKVIGLTISPEQQAVFQDTESYSPKTNKIAIKRAINLLKKNGYTVTKPN